MKKNDQRQQRRIADDTRHLPLEVLDATTRACPVCPLRRLHTPAELSAHHPFARHGLVQGHGWTHPALAVDEQRRKAAAAVAAKAK